MKKDLRGKFLIDGVEVELAASLDGQRLEIGGRVYTAVVSGGSVLLRADDGRIVHAAVSLPSRSGGRAGVAGVVIEGRTSTIAAIESGARRAHRSVEDAALEAPMPGTCREVFVTPGARVEKGARLVLIEAMKMEHEIRAPRAGVIKAVRAKKGEPVAPGTPLVELES
jgi:3-methylcrotonyl-CoA carboxylase alpha subunit